MDELADENVPVFCVPFAGGTASQFLSLRRKMQSSAFRLVPIELAGRGTRWKENLVSDLRQHAREVASRLAVQRGPYLLLGHSMGALIALEAVRHLEKEREALPQTLIVSAARAPLSQGENWGNVDSDESAIALLRRLGGTPAAVLAEPALLRRGLPTFRADIAMLAAYRRTATVEPVDVPIAAWGGVNDVLLQNAHNREWAALTNRDFRATRFDGGHFFPFEQSDEVERSLLELLMSSRICH